MIRINQLVKRYDRHEAVRGLSIDVEPGELFGFLGPNGAGKTTTLTVLAGLLEPTSGSVEVAGFDVHSQPVEAKRRMGYVPDRPYVYEKLTGREFLRLIADVYGMDAGAAATGIVQWLDTFEMTAHADNLIESYSHGMRQRIVLAATLLHDPDVVILDEPMVGLDPKGAKLIKQLLRQRCERGKTVLMSTHTLEVAQQMCDRVGIINQGELVAVGTLEALRAKFAREGASLEDIFLAMVHGEEARPTN